MESHEEPDSIGDLIQRRRPRRLFVLAGERRRRALNLQFASPPVAARNGLAPPARIGAPVINALQRDDKRVCAWGESLLQPQDPSNAAKTRKPQQTAIIPGLLTTENSCFENYATLRHKCGATIVVNSYHPPPAKAAGGLGRKSLRQSRHASN